MTDELGDAFDEASETDEATNALFRQAQSLDDTKRFAEGLFHEGSLYTQPAVQGETDAARAAWQYAERKSGGDVFGKAADGLDHVLHDKPTDLWEDVEPDHKFGPNAEPAIDMAGGGAIAGVQQADRLIESMNPASTWHPAAQLARDEWDEAKNVDLDKIPWKDPEIPDTDAVLGGDASTEVVLTPGPESTVFTTDATGSDDSFDHSTPAPEATYETPSVDTSTYDAPADEALSYETPADDTSNYDTTSDMGSAFGSTSDDSGSSFTDF
jgi:hypothetical protein